MKPLRYLSVCSGIEAVSQAGRNLNLQPVAFSEIESYPRAYLKHYYPDIPLHGDFTTIKGDEYGSVDILVGGTPCQSFSVAGKRLGLDDPRGNLAIEFLLLARRSGARWLVWENVPGVFSSWSDDPDCSTPDGNDGSGVFTQTNDFDTFLSFVQQCGYSACWRVLDSQYFGVPQRRRRVFVVGYIGDWRPPAAVLLERESLQGDITPRQEKGKSVAALTSAGVGTCGADDNQGQAGHLIPESIPETAWALQERDHKGADSDTKDGHLIACFNSREDPVVTGEVTGSISSSSPQSQAAAFNLRGRKDGAVPEIDDKASLRSSSDGSSRSYVTTSIKLSNTQANGDNISEGGQGYTLDSSGTCNQAIFTGKEYTGRAVRRLTPRECERLQGFPDDRTLIPYRGKPASDSARYKALGNTMTVPVMHWIFDRLVKVDSLIGKGGGRA